jgi:hypothetical protein
MNAPDLVEALRPVLSVLGDLGVRHFVGGSIASSAHGVARASLDVDVVAELEAVHVARFVAALQGAYYVDAARVRAAVENRRSFNLIHLATMFKVDVFVSRNRPFDLSAFQRAGTAAPGPGLESQSIPVASAEDVLLAKLEWYRRGGEVSERQWDDVVGIVRVGRGALDVDYLRRWAAPLGVEVLLERILGRTEH